MCLDMGKLPLTLQSVPANVNREDVIVLPPSQGTQNKNHERLHCKRYFSGLHQTFQRFVLEPCDTKQEHKVLICLYYQVKPDILKGRGQVRDPGHSVCRKIMEKLDFCNDRLMCALQRLLGLFCASVFETLEPKL